MKRWIACSQCTIDLRKRGCTRLTGAVLLSALVGCVCGLAQADLFMAWQFASYVEEVAAAGKTEYPLPMFANAALVRPKYEPGQYNSGGPLPHSMDLWRAAAKSLDFVSPDIYCFSKSAPMSSR